MKNKFNNAGSKKLGDITSIAAKINIPVLSERAKSVIEPLFGVCAEWLPINFGGQAYFLMNLLRISDSLDLENTKLVYRENAEVRRIEAYAFNQEALNGEWLFKVTQERFEILATERFRELVDQEGLTGFFFQPVWDSEHAPFRPTGRTKDIIGRPEIYGPEGFVPNVREYWPTEWIEQEKEMKKKAKQAAKLRSG